MKISLHDLLALATEAALEAGKHTLSYFNTQLTIETKSDNTPVTRADKESEEIIRKKIQKTYPQHTIIGEEGGKTEGDQNYRWIIDPIDGTKAFIHGVPLYGVLIGVEVEGKASVGVIHLPALNETVCAATGQGCSWNGKPAKVSKVNRLEDSLLLSSSIMTATHRSDAFEKISAKTKFQRTWGDCFGYVLVATGRAEIMMDPIMNPWDCAPMLPILEEAGGCFTNWQGEATIWGKDAIASNGLLHSEIINITRSEKRTQLCFARS